MQKTELRDQEKGRAEGGKEESQAQRPPAGTHAPNPSQMAQQAVEAQGCPVLPRDAWLCPGMPISAQGHEFASFLRYLPVMSFWASFFISELQPPFSKTG